MPFRILTQEKTLGERKFQLLPLTVKGRGHLELDALYLFISIAHHLRQAPQSFCELSANGVHYARCNYYRRRLALFTSKSLVELLVSIHDPSLFFFRCTDLK